jgi:transcriptional regulator with XRE-family HTH domain
MLALARVKEVERLLAEGNLSQRKIARLLRVSRATVSAIAAGRRPDYEAQLAARASEFEPLGPIERCPGCGGMVYTPCRLCLVRKLKEQEETRLRVLRRQAREQARRRLLLAVRAANEPNESDGEVQSNAGHLSETSVAIASTPPRFDAHPANWQP